MTNQNDKQCVLLFVKAPTEGRVKTRLAAKIGTTSALELYKCFVFDLLACLKQLGLNFRICFYPADCRQQIIRWLGEDYQLIAQRGADLGQRLKNAFLQTFDDNFERVIAIGSDSPDLPGDLIKLSLATLDTHEVVIGPAKDGGYYLIGFLREGFLPEVFENISWSTGNVFKQTVNILKRHKRTVDLLPQWPDVDTLADLKSLMLRNKDTAFNQSRTYSYLITKGNLL